MRLGAAVLEVTDAERRLARLVWLRPCGLSRTGALAQAIGTSRTRASNILRNKPVGALTDTEVTRLIGGAIGTLAVQRAVLEEAVFDAMEALKAHEATERNASAIIEAISAGEEHAD